MDGSLGEQADYYRQRAPEYEDWWYRRGVHVLPPDVAALWSADVDEAVSALADFSPSGDVLELACGTGIWTQHVVGHADRVLAVDAAEEMLALNRARMLGECVSYLRADLFAWSPPAGSFDVVLFGYWVSHVPDDLMADFWAGVARALRDRGRVFFIDSAPDPRLDTWPAGETEDRKLADGRSFRVVKRYRRPSELKSQLAALGWNAGVRLTRNRMILLGTATPVRP